MMRIGFGVTVLARCLKSGGIDGIGSYTRELMKRFLALDGLDLVPISYGHPLPPMDSMVSEALQYRGYAIPAVLSAFSGQPFPGAGNLSNKLDLMHATDHLIPNLGKVPVVATLMDAIPLSHPEWVGSRFRGLKNALWRRSAQWASHVVTISEYSKQEIETHFGLAADDISVIPLGVDERWFHPLAPKALQDTLRKHGLPENYFLFVGTLQPRKNISRVIDAHRSLPQAIRNEAPLVIVGRAGWQCDDVVEALGSCAYGSSVRWLRHLPDDDLLAVLKGAMALVFPSLYEGFGLPVLEAFAAGTPVITSNCTALTEVAGDAALLVDPTDTSSISEAMLRVLEDSTLAGDLREKGLARARLHSWDSTARMTLDVYKLVLGRH
jgi:glycosyltransferase involved in cell wall biosynthesis